jgi:signal transduction histidine kinase/DNA-binding response OmpR family regulator
MTENRTASILVVDDRPESRFAIEVALESLGEAIIKASSGEEALRHVLRQDFAVILLDVNMPRLDGFETAALIRSRRKSDHIPIIFITAYADDMHIARGYSLGAVDYILSPVVPEVLRSKVGFFVDLYRKNQEISRQAALLGERATRQRRLADASLAVQSVESLDALLEVVTTTAAELVESRWAATSSISDLRGGIDRSFARTEGGSGLLRHEMASIDRAPLSKLALESNAPMRLPDATVDLPSPTGGDGDDEVAASVRGWLAVPLRRRDGTRIGLIQVAGRMSRDFCDEDEAVLVQLGHMTSVAIDNVLLAREREANQMKDEFLATLSHELRTPLNSILGWTHILSIQAAKNDSQVAEGLAVIERSVRAQNRLIEDLLDVSRISRGEVRLERQVVDLGSVLQASIDAARPTANAKQVNLELEANGVARTVFADADRLQQVFGNLLSNALKFTPPGGTVKVRLTAPNGTAEVAVIDDGEGITPEFLPLVFERFRQADYSNTRRFSGLGIGLTIVKHLVEAHGGTIRVASAGRNCGTSVTVEIPVLRTAAAPVRANAGAAVRDTNLAGLRILVVDDQADARDVAAKILRSSGADVVGAGSVGEAFTLIDRRAPDLIISDLAMPDETGYALIARLRSLAPPLSNTPAIALSALVGARDRAEALAAGFQVHAAKPCDPEHLLSLAAMLTADRPRPNGRRNPDTAAGTL